jgi:hypothetical protein
VRLPNGRLHQEPLAKDGKHLALRNQRVLCLKYGGACTMYYLVVQKYEKRDEKLDSHAAKKGSKKLVISDFAKILEN